MRWQSATVIVWVVAAVLSIGSATLTVAADGGAHGASVQIAQVLRGSKAGTARPVAVVTSLGIREVGGQTVLDVDMDRAVKADAFVLGKPYRVIVDLPDVAFRVPVSGEKATVGGVVSALRYGKFAPLRSRIVLDARGPILLTGMKFQRISRTTVRLRLTIKRTNVGNFEKLSKAGLIGPPSSRRGRVGKSRTARKSRGRRPIIVIDPGHGGIDPGAIAGKNVAEKAVVLAVGLELRKILMARGKYKLLMTRETDEFVSLKDRRDFSVENGAALFLSLHADALAEQNQSSAVRGATVYTLSSKASDAAARRLAEKENSADLAAGLALANEEEQDQVRDILIDLMRRETSNFSAHFRRLLLGKLKGQVRLSKMPARSAAFAVLKQSETPSVLIELGYVSNVYDRKNLMSRKWRRSVAELIARAVDKYFASKKQAAIEFDWHRRR